VTPPRPILRIGWALHRAIFAASGGRLGTTRPGRRVGTLFLLARGRTTGTVRRTGLFYVEEGPAFAVVASNAGRDAEPDVEVGRQRIAVRAREATDDETARLWPRLVAGYPEFDAYRRNATRRIPVVMLERRSG
jgi:deazaflavin-dependent oxidoreductase (nitroreductase family)